MNEEIYLRFEHYLADEMTSEERLLFEEQLQNDASFNESFTLYKETTQFLEYKFSSEKAAFEQNITSIAKEHFASKKETKVIAFKPWYYAVAATIVVVVGTWMMMQNDPTYGDYNQHEMAVFVERSDNNENLQKAQEAFNKKDYQQAVAAFEKIQDFRKPELQYFYAIALIETNDFTKAELFLDQLRKGNSVYKDKATWYLALSYLKQNKKDKCKLVLQQIPVEAEDYNKAQELLKELE
ncbi:MAG: tetratricopeptide repeat protein [Flavobacterium sp.]|nr:tetratricopeptide repeat protein [Flavobacterium sp.]